MHFFFSLNDTKTHWKNEKKTPFFPPFFFLPKFTVLPRWMWRTRSSCKATLARGLRRWRFWSTGAICHCFWDLRGWERSLSRWFGGKGETTRTPVGISGLGKGLVGVLLGKFPELMDIGIKSRLGGGSRINKGGKVPRWGALMPNLSLGNCFLWQMEGKWSCMLFSIKKFTKFTNWDRGVGVMFLPLRPNDCFCSFISLSCLILGMPWVKTRAPQPPWVSHQQLQTRAQAFDMWQNEGIFFEVFDWVEVLQVPSNFRSFGQNRAKHLIWLGGMSLAMRGAPRESGLKCQHFPKRMQCRFNFYWEVAASPSFPSAG